MRAGVRPRIRTFDPHGSRLRPFTSNHVGEPFSKALLGTRWHQSKMLVSSVTILRLVCPMSLEIDRRPRQFRRLRPFPFLSHWLANIRKPTRLFVRHCQFFELSRIEPIVIPSCCRAIVSSLQLSRGSWGLEEEETGTSAKRPARSRLDFTSCPTRRP